MAASILYFYAAMALSAGAAGAKAAVVEHTFVVSRHVCYLAKRFFFIWIISNNIWHNFLVLMHISIYSALTLFIFYVMCKEILQKKNCTGHKYVKINYQYL
jgi:hypothetical protein